MITCSEFWQVNAPQRGQNGETIHSAWRRETEPGGGWQLGECYTVRTVTQTVSQHLEAENEGELKEHWKRLFHSLKSLGCSDGLVGTVAGETR